MDEYIKREEAIAKCSEIVDCEWNHRAAPVSWADAYEQFSEDLEELPASDVSPVRHGRWIDKPTGRYGQWQAWCSVCDEKCGCGGTIESQHKMFCPNCGARMDLKEDHI